MEKKQVIQGVIWVCSGHQEPEQGLLTQQVCKVRQRGLPVFPARGCHISLHIGGFKTVDEDKQEQPTGIFPRMFDVLSLPDSIIKYY